MQEEELTPYIADYCLIRAPLYHVGEVRGYRKGSLLFHTLPLTLTLNILMTGTEKHIGTYIELLTVNRNLYCPFHS